MDEVSPERISRRRMLKRIGAGAAVAWMSPVVTSLGTHAWAGECPECEGGPGVGCAVGGDDCFGQTDCSPPGKSCICLRTTEEECFCDLNSNCADLQPCNGTGDCPPGYACTYSCCGGTLCGPPCSAKPRRRLRGRTQAGRIG
jgi:hypothetical protein